MLFFKPYELGLRTNGVLLLLLLFCGGRKGNASCTVTPVRRVWDSSTACRWDLSPVDVRIFRWSQSMTFDLAVFNSLHDFLCNLSCLQNLEFYVRHGLGIYYLINFVFCGASEHGVWRDIRSVQVDASYNSPSEASHLFDHTVRHQPQYEKWWKSFTVTIEYSTRVAITASM